MSRVDMVAGADGVWVLEVNTIPGLTETSLVPRAAEAVGIAFPALVDRLIELAMEESGGRGLARGLAQGHARPTMEERGSGGARGRG
jgi:hypothetical protein